MTQDMPNKRFERNMNHNYMILSKCDFFGSSNMKNTDYRVRMLLENRIAGLLPVTHRIVNGESRYYYEINSLQSLDRLLEQREINCYELRALLQGCTSLFDKLEEYLLDGAQVIMKSEYIYMNVECMEPYFVYYPDYTGDVRISFMEFVDELLTKLDHSDEQAVMLGYQVYRYTRNPNYVLSEIHHLMAPVNIDIVEDRENKHHKAVNTFDDTCESACKETNPIMPVTAKSKQDTTVSEAGTNSFGYTYYDTLTEDDSQNLPEHASKGVWDFIGGVFCTFIAVCAAALLVCSRVLALFRLGENQELYLYGAVAMASVSAAIFFACFTKKKGHDKLMSDLRKECEEEEDSYMKVPDVLPQPPVSSLRSGSANGFVCNINNRNKGLHHMEACSETICLGNSVIEERILCGRVDGREINIPLNHLPMTIGKLAGFADFVINDNAVSKMHARFEERDGRIYLCDLNSTNGTVKNGAVLDINTPVPLEPGDRIRFGRTSFTYC